MRIWESRGGEGWQLVDPVDGFHPLKVTERHFFILFWGFLRKKPFSRGCPGYHGEGLFRKWSEYAQGPFYATFFSIGTFKLSHVLKLILLTKLVKCKYFASVLSSSAELLLCFSRQRRKTQNVYTNTC